MGPALGAVADFEGDEAGGVGEVVAYVGEDLGERGDAAQAEGKEGGAVAYDGGEENVGGVDCCHTVGLLHLL